MALSPSSRLGLPATAVLPEDTNHGEENEGMARTEEQTELRDGFRDHCRLLLLEEADRRDTTLTRRDVRDWLAAMDEQNLTAKTEAEKTKIVRSLAEGTYVEKFIQDARKAASEGLRLIADAEEKKWILPASAKEWRDRVKNESVSWVEKKKFIEETLPEWHKNWQKIATDYKDVKNLEKDLKMEAPEIKKFAVLSDLHDPKFMSGALEYPERRSRVDKALAFLKAYRRNGGKEGLKDMGGLLARAKVVMQPAITGKAVDAGRQVRWLEQKLVSLSTPEARRDYVDHKLPEYVKSCLSVRAEYDRVESDMQKNGVPRSFNRIAPGPFIRTLTLAQRRSYVETARARMREEEPFMTQMKNLKFSIWYALDTKDWEEADDLLKKARSLQEAGKGTEKDRADLRVMERNLQAFRDKEKGEKRPKEDARKTLADMRTAFEKIEPKSLQSLYLAVMNDGPDCFARFCQLFRNREWVTQHGYSDANLEKLREERAKQETEGRAKGEHSKKGAEFIHLGVVDDPQHSAAVRRYDAGEWAPTYIFMPHNTQGKLLEILHERQDNYAFGYWTTLIPTDVTYEQQLHLIHDVNWVLKSGMRKLKEHGLAFTRTGEPLSLN